MIKNYYKILEIDRNANSAAIRSSFRKLATFWHPDKNSNSIALAKMKELNEAYTILSDIEKRNVYNRIYDSYFLTELVIKPDQSNASEKTNFEKEKEKEKEKEDEIKEKFKEDYEKLSNWILNTNFSLKNIDKFIEKSIAIVDKPIENFAYYFPFVFIIIIVIIILSALL